MLMSVLAAFAAGSGLVFLLEMMDKSIRRASDLNNIVDNRLIVSIPYITTGSELRQHNRRMKVVAGAIVALVIIAGFVVIEVLPPLDLMIAKARVGIFKQ
jgi:hypothetical protein